MHSTYIWRRATPVAFAAFGILLLKQYMNGDICTSKTRIDGKVVIVTGANAGIGKETVTELVRRGGKIYLACRSLERAKLAVEDIKNATGADENQLHVMHLDLSSLKSIREFVKEFKLKEKKLDILINNAAVLTNTFQRTSDGFEEIFGTNYLGPFLLTNLLIDVLVAPGSRSRVINVSSRAHRRASINVDDLMPEKDFHGFMVYSQSKLANIFFSRELSRRVGTAVSVHSLHPGLIRTGLFEELLGRSGYPIMSSIFNFLCWPITKEPWYGAQTTVCCAIDEKLEFETGKYYSDCAEKQPFSAALDDEAAKRLWDISVELVKLDKSEMHSLIQ